MYRKCISFRTFTLIIVYTKLKMAFVYAIMEDDNKSDVESY